MGTPFQHDHGQIRGQNGKDTSIALFQQALHDQQSGQWVKAAERYEELLAKEPNHEKALVNLGILCFQMNQDNRGWRFLQKAVNKFPGSTNVQFNYGFACLKKGHGEQAAHHLQKAVQLDNCFSPAWRKLGNALSGLGRFAEAFEAYQQGHRLAPKNLELLNNWSKVCINLERYKKAKIILNHALKLYPKQPELHANLGAVYHKQWKLNQAEAYFKKAIDLNPADWRLHNTLGTLYTHSNEMTNAIEAFEKALTRDPQNSSVHSNIVYFRNYLPEISNAEHFENHCNWQQRHAPRSNVIPQTDSTVKPPPLRVGLLSGDFYQHPVAIFLRGWLRHLNADNIQLHAYTEIQKRDAFTREFRELCTGWYETNGKTDRQVAEKIRKDDIHILIDLAGHTKGNRLPVMGYKPAPVQISYLGYINTTGLPQIDYRIADKWVNPPETQRYYTDQLIYLPESYTCYNPPEGAPDVAPLPALKNGFITFGSFKNPSKINRKVVKLWADILHDVPESKLKLKARHFEEHQSLERYINWFEKEGINSDRLIFEGPSTIDKYFAAYNTIDIALDPFPHCGGTTTHDALYMGVPVITLAGDSYVSRMGVSIMNNLGYPEWIAESAVDYKTKVLEMAGNLQSIEAICDELRHKFLSSPLCNHKKFARQMEKLLFRCFRQYERD